MNKLLQHRLYLQDAYLREFHADVVAHTTLMDHPAVALSATAFYPTAGGQPHDLGTLHDTGVIDVVADNGTVWHLLDRPLVAKAVTGAIDWTRRFDHMQQHTGQHILSQAFIETAAAETVAFHLGTTASTIDVNRADVTADQVEAAETLANRVVFENRAVTARFVAPAELAGLPLRRPPKVQEDIRIVEIAGFDWSACGGTHVRHTGEIGLIKVIRLERRGPEARIEFQCGQRALADYRRKQDAVLGLMARLSTGEDDLLAAVDRLAGRLQASQRLLRAAQGELDAAEAARLWATAVPLGAYRLVSHYYTDRAADSVRTIAGLLRAQPSCVALLASETGPGTGGQLFLAAADDVTLDMGVVMRQATAVGARGGGRGAWAQGGAPDGPALHRALAAAVAGLHESIEKG